MDKKFVQDIMSQQFSNGTFVNPTRLILLTFITLNGTIETKYKRQDALEFIYRTFIDNKEIAARNSNLMVRNIGRYGLQDISSILDEALFEWKSDAQNNTLTYDSKWIYLNIDESDDKLVLSINTVVKMLYKKYFKINVLFPDMILDEDVINDTDLDLFGKGIFRNRVLEDMQYCPLCEETSLSNLFAVHLIPSSECCSLEDMKSKDNGIILCREHAELYLENKFSFTQAGFVCNCADSSVNPKMHLSFAVRTLGRRKYLRQLSEKNE